MIYLTNYLIRDRWPNWIRRSATNRETPDSSSGRSTKNSMNNNLIIYVINLKRDSERLRNITNELKKQNIINKDRWPNWIRRSATNREIPDSNSGRSTKKETKMFNWLVNASLQKSVIYFFITILIILLILTFVL